MKTNTQAWKILAPNYVILQINRQSVNNEVEGTMRLSLGTYTERPQFNQMYSIERLLNLVDFQTFASLSYQLQKVKYVYF